MDPMSHMEYQEGDIILVVPPVLNPNIPTLGASVLATACTRAGMATRIHYAHASFAAHIGFELCERLAAAPPRRMLGEAIFLAVAFPERAHTHCDILDVLAQAHDPLAQFMRPAALTPSEIARCAAEVPRFVSDTVTRLLAWSPRVVGFSSMCQQTLSSIAIASELKRLRPEIITVLGEPTRPSRWKCAPGNDRGV